jgi:hypothetical protein
MGDCMVMKRAHISGVSACAFSASCACTSVMAWMFFSR